MNFRRDSDLIFFLGEMGALSWFEQQDGKLDAPLEPSNKKWLFTGDDNIFSC